MYAAELHPLSFDALAFLAVICRAWRCRFRPRLAGRRHSWAVARDSGADADHDLSLTPVLLLWASRYRGMRLVSSVGGGAGGRRAAGVQPVASSQLAVLGQLVPGSSESTEWLWRGTNPNATGSSLTPEGQTMRPCPA